MQRYVDHDLNERETSALMAHIGQCPECAAMFERLVRLSKGLEQLPRVVPPYSLVDAILPELDRLGDAGREEAASISEAGRRAASTRRTWLAKMSGLVALGAAVALLFIFNPLGQPLNRSKQQEAASLSQANELADKSGSMQVADQYGIAGNVAPAPSGNNLPAESGYDLKEQDKLITSSAAAAVSPGNSGQDGLQSSNPEGGASRANEMAMDSIEADTSLEKGLTNEHTEAGEPAGGEVAPPEQQLLPEPESDESLLMLGFVVEPEEQVSPDGQWRAVLTGQTLQLYRMSDGSQVFERTFGEGTPGGLAWNGDSTELLIKFVDPEGRESEQKMRVSDWTELTD